MDSRSSAFPWIVVATIEGVERVLSQHASHRTASAKIARNVRLGAEYPMRAERWAEYDTAH